MPRFCSNINYSMNRRDFLGRFALGLGGVALTSLFRADTASGSIASATPSLPTFPLQTPHFPPKAKRIIYLFMAGGPSQHDLLD
jgi:hypothetical protein